MTVRHTLLAVLALAATGAASAQAVSFSSFSFASQVSTSGAFGGVNGIYGNGDVRLDGITIGSQAIGAARLQTVSAATIVLDDGLDTVNGGGNLAAGRGINAVADTWAAEGPATVTPNSADLTGALSNLNLSSIVVTRENPGSAVLDVSFATPTSTFLFWERGANSDLQVQALNAAGRVVGTYTILRGNYTATGIVVSTDNGAFQLAGQALGSIGLQTDVAVSRLRLSSYRSDVINFNGPDYKILAVSPVPEAGTGAMLAAGLAALAFTAARKRWASRSWPPAAAS